MEMTRRQFALSIAAATTLRSSLFEPTLSPVGVARGVVPGRVTWKHDPAAVTWDGTGSWWKDANNNQGVIDRMVSRSIRWVGNIPKSLAKIRYAAKLSSSPGSLISSNFSNL